MPIERLSIRRMRVLGAFPVLAVLDDLKISNFRGGACPQTPLLVSMFMLHRPVPPEEGQQTV